MANGGGRAANNDARLAVDGGWDYAWCGGDLAAASDGHGHGAADDQLSAAAGGCNDVGRAVDGQRLADGSGRAADDDAGLAIDSGWDCAWGGSDLAAADTREGNGGAVDGDSTGAIDDELWSPACGAYNDGCAADGDGLADSCGDAADNDCGRASW